jgi:hypothetical protein
MADESKRNQFLQMRMRGCGRHGQDQPAKGAMPMISYAMEAMRAEPALLP